MDLTLEYVKSKSEPKLSGLLPVVKDATVRLIECSYAMGIPIIITQGLRTIAEQNALYAQGRTTSDKIVTNAKGGYSNHNFGVAIDFALLLSDGKSVSWDTLKDGNLDLLPDWSQVVDEAKKLGFFLGVEIGEVLKIYPILKRRLV
ncbi:Peptidoglycan L-alanyl-D-glutamate endopeptidase CwlK precursor [compost metagenome]